MYARTEFVFIVGSANRGKRLPKDKQWQSTQWCDFLAAHPLFLCYKLPAATSCTHFAVKICQGLDHCLLWWSDSPLLLLLSRSLFVATWRSWWSFIVIIVNNAWTLLLTFDFLLQCKSLSWSMLPDQSRSVIQTITRSNSFSNDLGKTGNIHLIIDFFFFILLLIVECVHARS